MSKVNISGHVVYLPGPWGLAVPVPNAKITVVDRDLPGKSDDVILETTTDSSGNFSGEAAEWRDRLGPLPDPSDLPMFAVQVRESASQNFTTPPFPAPTLFDKVAFPPIVVPWTPGGPVVIDGEECGSPHELVIRVLRKMMSGAGGIELAVPPGVIPAAALAFGKSDAKSKWLVEHAPAIGPLISAIDQESEAGSQQSLVGVDDAAAICMIILAATVGASIVTLTVAVSVALILALIKGYDVDFDSDMGGGANDATQKFKIKFVKKP